jgi:hypothetical protein
MKVLARLPILAALAASLAAGGASFTTLAAFAHDARPTAAKPQGWAYPYSCCSGFDCREVAAPKRVHENRNGYVVPSGELIPYGDRRIKDSPDGLFHWCSQMGKDDGKTICLFVPQPGV